MWLLFSLVCVMAWGGADILYKIASDETDRDSHLKLAVWVGLVMGVCSGVLLLVAPGELNGGNFFVNLWRYTPASLSYILSMVIGYAGLRYLELSIVSPVQNASGALSSLCMLIFFLATGRIASVSEAFSVPDLAGTGLIVAGVIALAVVEQRQSVACPGEKKYRFGALALLFPLLYCVFDTVGTAADGILLDGDAGLGLGEIAVLILYGLTFFLAGAGAWVFMLLRRRKAYNPFAKGERSKAFAALAEQGGQVFYIFAMSAKPVLAAPVVASYCIVSVILSRVLLKEKLSKPLYGCVATVIAGIVVLGIAESI